MRPPASTAWNREQAIGSFSHALFSTSMIDWWARYKDRHNLEQATDLPLAWSKFNAVKAYFVTVTARSYQENLTAKFNSDVATLNFAGGTMRSQHCPRQLSGVGKTSTKIDERSGRIRRLHRLTEPLRKARRKIIRKMLKGLLDRVAILQMT